MSDIVKELRDLSPGPSWEMQRIGNAAAAEIERLRAALREIVDLGGAYGTASYAERADKIARAALKEDGDD